jgi:hypothetical protein
VGHNVTATHATVTDLMGKVVGQGHKSYIDNFFLFLTEFD